VQLALSLDADKATITLTGPADVWFGVGFGARAMADAPWTVIVDGSGKVSERKLADHAGGTEIQSTVTVVSTHTEGGQRTVVVSRSLSGAFTFNMSAMDTTIPIITAVGSGPTYGYHKDKIPASISLLPVNGSGACICPQEPKPFGQASGQLIYHPVPNQTADTGTGAVGFAAHKCANWPATNLINQTNPTCDIRYYRGGQWACHHMWSLLDADQEIPWSDQPLVLHHKYRFWVQPYNETYHTLLSLGERVGSPLLIGSPWELDVPKCKEGVMGCSMVEGTWIHTIMGNTIGKHTFRALNFHCHAPTCLSMSVYACPKGTAADNCNATVGKLLCEQRPVHGGSGSAVLSGSRFDETGYIAIPDCFWGDAEYGLEPPLDVDGLTLHMVKTSNATYGHYGEMAGGQPWVSL